MIELRWGTVAAVEATYDDRIDLLVAIGDEQARAIAYPALTGPLQPGARVLLNTTAVGMGLGTGGVHIVVATDADGAIGAGGHAMKLRYTPVQLAVDAVEQTAPDAIDAVSSLDGLPVVAAGLHSAVPAVAIGIRSVRPRARIAYVMTDAAALLIGFSDTVRAMRAAGLLDSTITVGQATGGDLEAVTLHGALAACRAVIGADVAIVGMGPGNLGTGSRWGFASLEVASICNTAGAMGARPVVVPRISFSDARARHRGLSHHTRTALEVTLTRVEVALAPLAPEHATEIEPALEAVRARHQVTTVALGAAEDALRDEPVRLRSMGRSFDDDPEPFRAAAAAGVLACR